MLLMGKVGRVLITEASHKLLHQIYRKCDSTSFIQKTTKVQYVYWSNVTVVTGERTQSLDSRFCFLCLESTSYKCIRNSQPDQIGLVLKDRIQPRKTRKGDAWGLQMILRKSGCLLLHRSQRGRQPECLQGTSLKCS